MDFRRLLTAVRRFWPVVLVVLVATAIAVALVPRSVSADYEAKGTAVILSPSTEEIIETGQTIDINPWSRFGASGGVATAMIEVLQSQSFEREVMVDDAIKEYTVTQNQGGNGGILDIEVLATDANAALVGFDKILDRLVLELDSQQEASGAPPDTWLTADALTVPTKPVELRGSQTRAMAAIAVLGVLAAVALAAALDAVVSARRRARDASDHDDENGEAKAGDGSAKGASGGKAEEGRSSEVSAKRNATTIGVAKVQPGPTRTGPERLDSEGRNLSDAPVSTVGNGSDA